MSKKIAFAFLIVIPCFFFTCTPAEKPDVTTPATSYVPADQALFDTVAVQDSLLFTAFNSRNLEGLSQFFDSTLEVYQDNIGIRSYGESMGAFKGLFEKDYVLTRKLVKSSLEIYPIKDYGAIETGQHTFCHVENGKEECSIFKFVHIWEKKSGRWKITRMITYDHK